MSSTADDSQQVETSVRSMAEISPEEPGHRAYLTGFPSRLRSSASGSSLSNGQSNSLSSLKYHLEDPNVILKERLRDVTKFAVIDLIASILRFDLCDSDDTDSVEFCKETFEMILKHADLPERTNTSLRWHLEGEGTTDDITSLITVIREDPFLCDNDGVVLLGCLLMIFIERGKYDCRCRVLLRHLSTLLGVRWDDFEDMEDGLTDVIVEQEYNESE